MQLLPLIRKTLATSFLCSNLWAQNVGDIIEQSGIGGITREQQSLAAELGLDIMFRDAIETGRGRLKINFLDDTKLSLTEHSEVVVDEYIYDPNPSNSKMTMRFVAGTARFATGQLGLVPKENITINTPTATIGVRGTDFTTTVDELGRSLVILLPDAECEVDTLCVPSGAITVTNNAGTVTLTEAYQATVVSSLEQVPTQPVVLENMTMNIIDNMFIVAPPREIRALTEDERTGRNSNSGYSLLDFSDLDINYLEEDWDDEDLEFTELDIDLLDVDFLEDLLNVIDEADALANNNDSGLNIQGTAAPGFDSTTQFSTIIDQAAGSLVFYRYVTSVISVRLSMEQNATLETETDGKKNVITLGNGNSVLIVIRQGG
jgi:hypothetical protein